MMRRIIKGLLGLIGIAALGLGGFWLYMRTSLPDYDGTVTVAGLDGPVEIVRDADAVPHILAASQKDAVFAIGYAHAQDRLWQLEMNRRIGQGRLAEILGKEALETDRFMRIMGFYRRAEQVYQNLDKQTQQLLDAYAAGINAYLTTRTGALPPEFVALGVKPAPWKPADSLVWLKLMSLDLGYRWRTELARFSLSSRLSGEKLNQLIPPYPGDPVTNLPKPEDLYPGLLPPPMDAKESQGKGSNNWVVAGSRTTSGKPLLANDPHLTITAPGIWYLTHMRMGNRNVVGVTMPSLPFVVLGRTDTLAWGFTNTAPDTHDLIVEKLIDPAKGSYATPDGEALLTTRREVISVKNAEDVTIVVRESRNGPIISDGFEELRARLGNKYAMAIRWIALDTTDSTARAGLKLNLASTVDEAMTAAKDFVTPQQNIIFADTAGNIGYYAPARVPIRSEKHPTQGLMPTPGWLRESDWIGEIPYDALPREYNPQRGYVATANQKIVGPDYPYTITRDWEDPDRYDRIVALINATAKHDIDSFKKMQADIYSEPSKKMRDAILPVLRGDKKIPASLVDALAKWDGTMAADRPEPLIMVSWQRHFVKRLTEDDLGPLFKENWQLRTRFVINILAGQSEAAQWCDVISTRAVESCNGQITAAMADSLAELSASQGGSWESWQWGKAHQAVAAHRPFSAVPWLARYFDFRRPVGGSSNTVNVAHPTFDKNRPYDSDLLASYRGIFDLSDLEKSHYIQPTGQSGNPMSRHYDDFADRWATVQYRTIPTTDAAIKAEAKNRLVLTPQAK